MPSGSGAVDKRCCSPCSSTSPSPSPSAIKSSTDSVTTTSSSGDEGEGTGFLSLNGIPRNVTPDGVLTPPKDVELQPDGEEKPVRYNGRLEFYKEGVLCLELSHCEEGQGRKWLKTKGRSDLRQVVKVSKEVSIPCSPTPSMPLPVNPPNGFSSPHDRLSDEASSAASSSASPKCREKSWRKQPVPQKGISRSVQFFMKASPCVHHFFNPRPDLRELSPRRPYALPPTQCSGSGSGSPLTEPLSRGVCDCGEPRRRTSWFKNRDRGSRPAQTPVDAIAMKLLTAESEKHVLLPKGRKSSQSQGPRSTPQRVQSQHSNVDSSSSRKRSKDVDRKEWELKGWRAKKKGGAKKADKTILCVPGVGTPFFGTKKGNAARSAFYGCDTTDGKGAPTRPTPPIHPIHEKLSKNQSQKTPQMSSPCSLLRPTADFISTNKEQSPRRENANASDDSCQGQEEMLSPEEQEQIQKHAMSKAISYTITSLLREGPPATATALGKLIHSPPTAAAQFANSNSKQFPQTVTPIHQPNLFGAEQHDTNSFLRHLLDTSDPIPTSPHAAVASTPTLSAPSQPLNQSPQKTLKSKAKGRKNNKSPLSDASVEPRSTPKGRPSKVSGTGEPKTPSLPHARTFGNPTSSLPPYATPLQPQAQLESLAAATVYQYASRLQHPSFIPPPTKPSFRQPPHEEAPINLSQKDGQWPMFTHSHPPSDPTAKGQGKGQAEGRTYPNVSRRIHNEDSDSDLPLNLCKKRRDD